MNGNEPLDPVVERTRQAREALARQCGHDADKMMELYRSMQAEHPERVRQPAPTLHPQGPDVEAV
jgi:hypothetical protein